MNSGIEKKPHIRSWEGGGGGGTASKLDLKNHDKH